MRHHREKKENKLNYKIEEWHISTLYDIFRNQTTYPTVCLLLDTWNHNDHCLKVFGKWIFNSNLKVALPLTQDPLNYKCRGNETDENKFIGILYTIIVVPPEAV